MPKGKIKVFLCALLGVRLGLVLILAPIDARHSPVFRLFIYFVIYLFIFCTACEGQPAFSTAVLTVFKLRAVNEICLLL